MIISSCLAANRVDLEKAFMLQNFGRMLLVASPLVALAMTAAAAQPSNSEFFKGKQITISVGAAAGGGYDTYARLIARFIGRHIPGNPTMIVSNQPGAGGNQAATRLATIDPRDGTAIAALQSGVLLHPLLG